MEQWKKEKLESCLLQICNSLNINDTILKLRVRNIFDLDDEQLILNNSLFRNDSERRQKIIDILTLKSKNSYWIFCHIIKTRSPEIYNVLHDYSGGGSSNAICIVCNGKDSEEVIACNSCKGLLSVFSDANKGVFIEKPEEIVELFQNNHSKIQSLKNDLQLREGEVEKLQEKRNDLVERNLLEGYRLTIKEQQLADKEKEFEKILTEKDLIKIDCEMVTLKTNEYKNKIEKLNAEIQKFIEKESRKYENIEPNCAEKTRIGDLEVQIYEIESKLQIVKEELTSSKQDASRFRIKNETLENLLERQRTENNRIFTDLKNKVEHFQNQCTTHMNEIEACKEQIQVSSFEKEETMKDHDHLLNKVYEKDKTLKEVQLKLNSTEKQKATMKAMSDNQVQSIKRLTASKEDLLNQYKDAKTERNNAREKHDELSLRYDELVMKLIDSQKQNHADGDKQKCNEEEAKHLEDQIEMYKRKVNELCETRPTDTEIVLRKIGDKFGVKFGVKKGPVLLGESNIIVSGIDLKYTCAPVTEVRDGDFIIKINDVNVQECNMDMVKHLCSVPREEMKLVLRRQDNRRSSKFSISLDKNICERFDDLGIHFGITATISRGSMADKLGFHDFDEFLVINNRYNVKDLSISEVEGKINKHLKQQQQVDVLVNRSTWLNRQNSSSFSISNNQRNSITSQSNSNLLELSNPESLSSTRSRSSSSFNVAVSSSKTLDNGNKLYDHSENTSSFSLHSNSSGNHPHSSSKSSSSSTQSNEKDIPPRPVQNTDGFIHSRSGSRLSNCSSSSSKLGSDRQRHPTPTNFELISDSGNDSDISVSKKSDVQPSNRKFEVDKKPELLPREKISHPQESTSPSKLTNLDYTKEQPDGYSYVVSKQFDADHNPIGDAQQHTYKNKLKMITVEKKDYESFGLQLIGGNKIGIFVRIVENWKPAQHCGIGAGWRVLQINGLSLEHVAFCYAVEVLQRCNTMTSVPFLFEAVPYQEYQEMIRKKPYDSFHVRALIDYQARAAREISFKAGEILCVTDSYVITEPGQPYKWAAMKEELSGTYQISGYIPRQISPRAPTAIAEHTYEEIDEDVELPAQKKGWALRKGRQERRKNVIYYKILEPVGEVLV